MPQARDVYSHNSVLFTPILLVIAFSHSLPNSTAIYRLYKTDTPGSVNRLLEYISSLLRRIQTSVSTSQSSSLSTSSTSGKINQYVLLDTTNWILFMQVNKVRNHRRPHYLSNLSLHELQKSNGLCIHVESFLL